jgi:hypothetical protein
VCIFIFWQVGSASFCRAIFTKVTGMPMNPKHIWVVYIQKRRIKTHDVPIVGVEVEHERKKVPFCIKDDSILFCVRD